MFPPLPWRRARAALPADVGQGFVATEAPALQAAIRSAFVTGDGAGPLAVELSFERGAGRRVMVVWRNRYVGFVPQPQAADIRRQLDASDRVRLVAEGQVYNDGTFWRVWVGPPFDAVLPEVDSAGDLLVPPPPTIFGIPLGTAWRRPQDPDGQD